MTGLIMLVMIGVTGRVVTRYGFKSPMIVGLGLLAACIALLGRAPVDGNFVLDVLIPSLIAAVGMSLTFIPTLIAALSSARPDEEGLASALVNTTYQVGWYSARGRKCSRVGDEHGVLPDEIRLDRDRKPGNARRDQ